MNVPLYYLCSAEISMLKCFDSTWNLYCTALLSAQNDINSNLFRKYYNSMDFFPNPLVTPVTRRITFWRSRACQPMCYRFMYLGSCLFCKEFV